MNRKKRKRWIRRHGGSGRLRTLADDTSKIVRTEAAITNTGIKVRSVTEYTIRDIKEDCRYDVIHIDGAEPTAFEYFRKV